VTVNPALEAAGWPFVIFIIALTLPSILWVVSLVPFTLALVSRPARPRANPVLLGEARAALLALNVPEHEYRLVPLSDTEMRLDWNVVDASWYELFAKVKFSIVYRARLYLHEPEHEVRCHETLRSSSRFIGFDGFRPRFSFQFYYRSGALNVIWSGFAYGIKKGFPPQIGQVYSFSLDTIRAKREIAAAANTVGWAFRPVALKLETTAWGIALAERLTPPFMRGWSRKKFWGVLYATSWAGIIASSLSFVPWTAHNLLVLALVFVPIAGFQAIFVWASKAMERYSARKAVRRR
jgi:hypothetical protein